MMISNPAAPLLGNVAADKAARYTSYLPARRPLLLQALPWAATLLAVLLLPQVFSGLLGISVLTQMGVAITFALAYNMLLGGTGLLSFGHALYFGIGAYVTAHLLNHFGSALPLVLLPLAGGLAALAVGAVLALFTVRHDKTTYAMISMSIGQLAYAAATIMAWSGGDAGIRLDPTVASGWGFDFGAPRTMYFLVSGWAWLCALAMFLLTRTPLGRLMNATRDNAERIEFTGFSPIGVRGLALTLSAGFAGLAGSLYALSLQVVTTDVFGLPQTTVVMLQTYIGGFGSFIGPVLGATLMTLSAAHLSALTDAWQLYIGAFFITVIIFSQRGLVGAIGNAWVAFPRRLREQGPLPLAGAILANCLWGLMILIGFIGTVEMVQSWSQNDSAPVTLLRGALAFTINPHAPVHWICSILLLAFGVAGLRWARKRF
jgi:branched-chain amino acid transport system permease protein